MQRKLQYIEDILFPAVNITIMTFLIVEHVDFITKYLFQEFVLHRYLSQFAIT